MDGAEVARERGVWALALGQTLAYAALFYLFAALVRPWQQALGWDKAALAAGPTLALLIAAVLAPLAGRLVDRGHGPAALTVGAALGGGALIWLSQVESHATYLLAWGVIGVANAAALYEVCFAFLISRIGPDARSAILRVTLVAGFASTISFPAGAALEAWLGWRGAVLVAAAVVLGAVVPLHAWGARLILRGTPPPEAPLSGARASFASTLRRRGFARLAAIFALVGLNHWMVVSFLVPIFVEQGALPANAVLAAATVGPAQVAGRLVLLRFEARIGNVAVAWVTVGAMLVAALVLGAIGLSPWLVFAYTTIQGAAMGVMTILRPVLIAEVLGRGDYGAVAGIVQMPALLAAALAPALAAFILDGLGLGALIATSVILVGLALGTFATLVVQPPQDG
jgi:predicted MFS family arabinose efflux permease